MAVCMRPVWYFDGAGLLCIYAEDKSEYLDCLIRGGADGVRFYAFYLVENRNTRCDSGLFYPVLSGYPVKKVFAEQWLEWLESWVLS